MILKMVEAFLQEHQLLDKTLIVGFSGGYDSMCLLHVLKQLSLEYRFKLIAIHLNHGWRGAESDKEAQVCEKFCKDIEYYSEKLPENCPHTETYAREQRYIFFEKCAKKFNADAVLTAHNANDNAETIFYRLLKGTGLTGLEGIQEQRDIYYRPLLKIYRDDIEKYCQDNNLKPNNDSSNNDTMYARNRIRHEIFPKIKKYSKNFIENLNKLSDSAKSANEIITKNIKSLEKYTPKEFSILSANFQCTIVHKFLRNLNLDYDKNRILKIVDFINKNKNSKAGKTLSLSNNKWLFVNTEKIEVVIKKNKDNTELKITNIGEYTIDNRIFEIRKIDSPPSKYPKDDEYTAYAELSQINFTLRHRKDGDIIQPLGINGTQKLKKYLNGKKIPNHEKEDLILLAQNNEILWVAGIGISDKIKVKTNPTHILTVKRGEQNEQ